MPEPSLATKGLFKRFGGLLALDDVNLAIAPGELHALIGPNGAGKTTLVAHLAGELRPDAGTILFAGKDITGAPPFARSRYGLGRSFQITSIFSDLTVLDNVALAVQAHDGHSFRFWQDARRASVLRLPARDLLGQVGLAQYSDKPAGILAHGEKRALEIAMVLATRPRLLLLDEPMAGMGPEDSARMVALLASLKRTFTILLVEHDMDAVFSLADRVSVLVNGRIIADGTIDEIRRNDDVRRAYLGDDDLVDA